MSEFSFSTYRIIYAIAVIFVIARCIDSCYRYIVNERSPSDDAAPGENNNGGHTNTNNNNDGDENNNTAEELKRRELVRSSLVFRQVLSPPSSSTATQTIQSTNDNERDLEMAVMVSSTIKETMSDADDSIAIAATADGTVEEDNDDDDDDGKLQNKNNDSSVKSIFSSLGFFNSAADSPANDHPHQAGAAQQEHQDCCSICLEGYAIGDTVARSKKTTREEHNSSSSSDDNNGNNNTENYSNGDADPDADGGDADNNNNNNNSCSHCFHEDCILEWLQRHDECPLCRVDMIDKNNT